ncbi:MAG: cytochrome d ubiquinol oxidase subunit II [bacterium]
MNVLSSPVTAFGLLFILFAIYTILDGYALGIGCLVPWIRKKAVADRLVDHIAPVWEANEVWLVMAIGFLFAAFPAAFAILCSTFYLPLMTVAGALALRAVALEFSYHDPRRTRFWRSLLGLGSFLILFSLAGSLGFVLAGLPFRGPDDIRSEITAAQAPLALLFGLSGLGFFIWHGILHARTGLQAAPLSRPESLVWALTVLLSLVTAMVWISGTPGLPAKPFFAPGILVYLTGLLVSRRLTDRGAWAFRATALAILGLWVAVAACLFPNLLVSANNPDWSLSILQASAPASSLQVVLMTTPILAIVIAGYSICIQRIVRR